MKRPSQKHLVAVDAESVLGSGYNIGYYSGYRDPFTRDQSPMAEYANNTRVEKVASDDPTDLNPAGALGTVLGSIGKEGLGVAYFVEWDSAPRRAVLVMAAKLKRHG